MKTFATIKQQLPTITATTPTHSTPFIQNPLAKSHKLGNNTATTKPLHGCTPSKRAFLLPQAKPTNTTQHGCVSSFVGLIGVNTTPVTGNSPSRVKAVVETQRPIFGRVHSLTKTFTTMQNLLTITATTPRQQQIIHFLNHASPITLIGIGAVLGLPIACLVIGILAVMGV